MAANPVIKLFLSNYLDLSTVLQHIGDIITENPETLIEIIYNNSRIWVEILESIFRDKSFPYFRARIVPYDWIGLQSMIKLMKGIELMTPLSIKQIRDYYQRDYGIESKFAFPPFPGDYIAREITKELGKLQHTTWVSLDVAVTYKPDYGYLSKYLDIPLYSSGRPKTTMPFLGQLTNVVLETDMIRIDYGIFQYKSDFYAPILRYAEGMSRGGYYNSEAAIKSYCGTFYYIDLDEDRYLRLGNFRIFRNKYAAFMGMKESIPNEELQNLLEYNVFKLLLAFDDPTDEGRQSSLFSCAIVRVLYDEDSEDEDLENLSPEQQSLQRQLFYDFMIESKKIVSEDGRIWYDPETNRDYTGRYIDLLYADEDRFDQAICLMAKHLEIDCIILTHMVGKTRLVSELLDTRDRVESYGNIVRFSKD